MSQPVRVADNPMLGILLMLAFCVLAPFADAVAKLLGTRFDVGQLVLIRFAAQAAIFAAIALAMGRFEWPTGRVGRLVIWRTGLHIIGTGTMFLALTFLPLADTIAIAYVMPFLVLLLGFLFLGEAVGPHRIAACIVGFVGTLMVIQPSFAAVGWPALLPVVVAVDFAAFTLVTRAVAKDIDPVALQAASGIMAVAVLAPAMLILSPLGVPGAGITMPGGGDWGLLVLMGLLAPIGHLFFAFALRIAPSATLAPMQYLEIPVAAVLGWLIFREFPNGLALAGIVVTVAAGLYVVLRERRLSRGAPTTPRGVPPAEG
ncbi:EamA family transporter [Alphaproteobacteria bacterium GH1-50]|uniref:EamA family transporter n=1 Tax=Kangsaoukella pontilimi TaxID=2691042 RepID=A0A7C9IE79_9RHOB|nr:DMT family transporter [Kangsaoukella pontilimi]MXQ06527.1 EamA family transporter [Kangsaoukella pontilimi]